MTTPSTPSPSTQDPETAAPMPAADTETRSVFVIGLRNAHAMENQALAIMRPQLDRTDDYPEVAQRLQQHIA